MKTYDLLIIFALLCMVATERRLRHKSRYPEMCKSCPPGWGVSKMCNHFNKTVCAPCNVGISYSPHHSYRAPCWQCSRCGQGLYAAHPCHPSRDTICDSCPRLFSVDQQQYRAIAECSVVK
ncbi:hypothetical protein LSTR_LSTR007816 [Laodelphax striatellus]|uniref:TNFR-Cys domain-containing protein n=1 Tax=Laodelphax striatellus TaxID=195883 RepID=A0A482WMM6_LAOST|nr:hypothetical protein LSTR_LSTR007816 [Laodelphax striatellus]